MLNPLIYVIIVIQVTKLDRDPASGTALQEISFWLNLERALMRIQEKRDSLEIALTLDILKHGKRFHATLSFDTDTGMTFVMAEQKCVINSAADVCNIFALKITGLIDAIAMTTTPESLLSFL